MRSPATPEMRRRWVELALHGDTILEREMALSCLVLEIAKLEMALGKEKAAQARRAQMEVVR